MDMDDEDVKELGLSRVRSNALKTLMRQLREASPASYVLLFPLLLRISFCLLLHTWTLTINAKVQQRIFFR